MSENPEVAQTEGAEGRTFVARSTDRCQTLIVDTEDDYGREGASTPDIRIIREYGATQPGYVTTFAERRPETFLVVLVHDDRIAQHAATLRALVSRPDRLEVRFHPYSGGQLEALRLVLSEELMNRRRGDPPRPVASSVGMGAGVVSVWMDPGHDDIADDVRRRFGDAVSIEFRAGHWVAVTGATALPGGLDEA